MAINTFSSIPTLDYDLLKSLQTRQIFIDQLRHALISVGFFYLLHPPISLPASLTSSNGVDHPSNDAPWIAQMSHHARQFFELEQEEKDAVAMTNSAHFLGYTRLGSERTKGKRDEREQFDFATPFAPRQLTDDDPVWKRLWGPSQYPRDASLPGFQATLESYLAQVETLSYQMIELVAEALGLQPNAFDQLFDKQGTNGGVMHRAKLVKYPTVETVGSNQGVGPHYDGGFLTFLVQASPHAGLQVQNLAGQWIDAPPIPDSFVVNIGKALETVTLGLARATSHRVLSPPPGSGPRFSIPFFQNTRQEARRGDLQLKFPPEIMKLQDARGAGGVVDSVNYAEYDSGEAMGLGNLIGRVKSHPDVAQRHYPELFQQFFPDGLPAFGSAY